jgi:hypothetical protein
MSRLAERVARLEAKLVEDNRVLVVTIAGGADRRDILVLIDGDPKSRVEAIKRWYREHDQPMRKEHAEEVRAYKTHERLTKLSTRFESSKPAKPSVPPPKSTRTKGRP